MKTINVKQNETTRTHIKNLIAKINKDLATKELTIDDRCVDSIIDDLNAKVEFNEKTNKVFNNYIEVGRLKNGMVATINLDCDYFEVNEFEE